MGNFSYPVRVPTRTQTIITPSGAGPTGVTGGVYTMTKSNVKTGSSVPEYIAKIKNGVDASSSYTRANYQRLVPYKYRMRSLQRWGGQNVDSFKEESGIKLEPDYSFSSTNVSNEASAILKRKLRNFTGQSNQLINLAELRELPRMIKGLAGSAGKLIKIVNSSKKRGSDLKRFASDQWLQWSFGVMPTLGAIDGAIESVQSYLSRQDQSIREYGIHKTDWKSASTTSSTGSHHFNVTFNGEYKHTLSVKIVAGYRYQLSSANNYTLDKHLGFDISSVVPTIWELIPYSWMIDYFTTAGQFIEDTFSVDFGTSIYIAQCTVFRVEGIVTATPVAIFPKLSPLIEWSCRPQKLEYFSFQRAPLTALPRAPLRFKTSEEVAFNAVNKLLNLAALLGSKRN